MGIIYWMHVDGTVRREEREQAPSREEMEKFVGGWTEHVNVWFKDLHCHMFVHENGLAEGLEFNPMAWAVYATNMARQGKLADAPVVGNAVLWEGFPFD